MVPYSTLIRKLVDALARCEGEDSDIADILKNRCFYDDNIIRRTLMNAVCDPRFRFRASSLGFWKKSAVTALNSFVQELESESYLSEERANILRNRFLYRWFRGMLKTAPPKRYFTERTGYSADDDGLGNEEDFTSMSDALAEFDESVRSKNEKKANEVDKNAKSGMDEEAEADGVRKKVIEDRFLRNLPPSLVKLARLIGRVGNANASSSKSSFMRASKSDISGITIGNDMTAILPSELALLSEADTSKLFYEKYAGRKLQLFGSLSESGAGHLHKDGPVIICLDTSSSMTGKPITVAICLTLAVAVLSWRKHRNVMVVKYSDDYGFLDAGTRRSGLPELMKFLEITPKGGNNENEMFKWLFDEIKPDYSDYETADILCISDFGWCELTNEIIDVINAQKSSGMRFYGLNVIPYQNEYDEERHGLSVMDSLWIFSKGKCMAVATTL